MRKPFRKALFFSVLTATAILFILLWRGSRYGQHPEDLLNWVSTGRGCVHIETFKSRGLQASPKLVFVIHGDAPFNKPGYQCRMAAAMAARDSNTIAIGILRPGYTDPEGNSSEGARGLATGDNYTPDVIGTIAATIAKLKAKYQPSQTLLIGHSGGAAIAADVACLKKGLVNKVLLVSCPCNLQAWRRHMLQKQFPNLLWLLPVGSISPMAAADSLGETSVLLVVGDKDEVTPARLSREYYNKLKARQANTKLVLLPGRGHEILLDKQVVEIASSLLN